MTQPLTIDSFLPANKDAIWHTRQIERHTKGWPEPTLRRSEDHLFGRAR